MGEANEISGDLGQSPMTQEDGGIMYIYLNNYVDKENQLLLTA